MKPNSNIESHIQFKFVRHKSLLTCLDKMIYKNKIDWKVTGSKL